MKGSSKQGKRMTTKYMKARLPLPEVMEIKVKKQEMPFLLTRLGKKLKITY